MNKVFLIGRLTRDPELRHTPTGTAVCQINVAVSRPTTQGREQEADFINVVVWNRQAETVSRYLAKGRQIAVEGRIQTRSYDNNEGRRTYVTEVIASNVEFLGSVNDNNRQASEPMNDNPFDPVDLPHEVETTSVDNDLFFNNSDKVEFSDNDLPF